MLGRARSAPPVRLASLAWLALLLEPALLAKAAALALPEQAVAARLPG